LTLSFVLVGISVLVFFIAAVIPRDPAAMWIPGQTGISDDVLKALRAKYHLDEPVYMQFYYYFIRLLQGDLGISPFSQRPVADELMARMPASLELGISSFLLSLAIGIPVGIISATKRNKLVDHIARVGSLVGVSIAQFWLGLMLQYAFYYYIPLFPEAGGRVSDSILVAYPLHQITGLYTLDSLLTGNWPVLISALQHLILPSITMSSFTVAIIARMTRVSMLEVLGKEYIKTARAYGFSERFVILKYALKNSLTIITTVCGICVGWLLTGMAVVEIVFYWPGLGTYVIEAIYNSDFPAVVGWVLFNAFVFTMANLIVDLINIKIDPRTRV
jgi:peptide/nickel transport system permease protein